MPDEKSQIEKFRQAARELGADDDVGAFETALRKVAKAPKLSDDEIRALAKRLREGKDA
jgi:hypothetical protein